MQKQLQTVKTIDEIEKFWDNFSQSYTDKFSISMSAVYISMITMMNIEKADTILETAVGPGILIPHLIQRVKKGAKIYLTDLATDFLAILQKKLELFQENPAINSHNLIRKDLPIFEKPVHFENFGLTLQKANSEDLVDFQDNSIDAYISSLCLQITENPQKMIKEAFRNGKACMSVWGDPEKSQLVNMIPSTLKKYGIQPPKERSYFHLQDRQTLIKMFESEGFGNILCWNQFLPSSAITKVSDINEVLNSTFNQPLLNQIPQDKKDEVIQAIYQGYKDLLDQKLPNGLDILVIYGEKLN